ncbi:MAG: SDR family NAD(P)-dependent oxidoreductase, partial [Gammaproteobacteria bacterium]
MRLNGARILLTGAAGGLGSALARRFAARGARLGLVDLNPQPLRSLCEELQAGNGSVEGIDADLSRAEGREAVVRWVERAWQGGVDVLVNN